VGYVYDERNANLIPEDVYQRVEEIRGEIISGNIDVPSS
jgi:basic membrane lipoprotein Med (substrate-binding protein (PBP1-ABC) superfamily)